MRFGLPTSSLPSGVTVAAFRPSPCSRIGCRGLVHDLVVRAPAGLEREVEARELELEADHVGREDADGLFEQLLPGLVPLEDGDRARVHRAESSDCNLAQNCFDLVSSRRSTGEGDSWRG